MKKLFYQSIIVGEIIIETIAEIMIEKIILESEKVTTKDKWNANITTQTTQINSKRETNHIIIVIGLIAISTLIDTRETINIINLDIIKVLEVLKNIKKKIVIKQFIIYSFKLY